MYPLFKLLLLLNLFLFSGLLEAVELQDGPHVEITNTTATIRWKTDVECGTRIRFGQSADKLDQKAGEGVAIEHSAILTSLKPSTTYFFTVGTARTALGNGSFKTTGDGKPAKNDSTSSTAQAPQAKTTDSKPKPPKPSTPQPPPLRQIWGDISSLEDHFIRHGPDFNSKSAEHYAQQAWYFLQRAMDENLPTKYDESDGTIRIFDPKTGAFAAYRRDGRARTYFKPGSRDYFQRQPGNVVRLKRPQK